MTVLSALSPYPKATAALFGLGGFVVLCVQPPNWVFLSIGCFGCALLSVFPTTTPPDN